MLAHTTGASSMNTSTKTEIFFCLLTKAMGRYAQRCGKPYKSHFICACGASSIVFLAVNLTFQGMILCLELSNNLLYVDRISITRTLRQDHKASKPAAVSYIEAQKTPASGFTIKSMANYSGRCLLTLNETGEKRTLKMIVLTSAIST